MTPHTYKIYERIRASGGKVVAIADYQRDEVAANFGPLHDVTIKNGISTRDFDEVCPRPYRRGEPIHVGTLSRIGPNDMKGVQLAARAVEKLQQEHDAFLTIAGPVFDQATYAAIVAPILGEHVTYVGAKRGKEKAAYLADMHVGAALSNPGGWDDKTSSFSSWFAEGNSLTLHEMIYSGAIPISTDSGGAEPLRDAGLSDFIVPLDVISEQGMDAFTDLAAQKMLRAAHCLIKLSTLRSKARTIDDVGNDYAEYIMGLLDMNRDPKNICS